MILNTMTHSNDLLPQNDVLSDNIKLQPSDVQQSNIPLRYNRRTSCDTLLNYDKISQVNNDELINNVIDNNQKGLRNSSVCCNQLPPTINLRFNNLSRCNQLKHLSMNYPEISNEILINMVYNIELNSIRYTLSNKLKLDNNILLEDICDLLWNDITHKNRNDENDKLQYNMDMINEIKFKLVDYNLLFSKYNNAENSLLSCVRNNLKHNQLNDFKLSLDNIAFIRNQYDNMYNTDGLLYTYSALKSILLNNNKHNDVKHANNNYDDIINELNVIEKTIQVNIDGLYNDCLSGNSLLNSNDLDEINNIILQVCGNINNKSMINKLYNNICMKLSNICEKLSTNKLNEQYIQYINNEWKKIKQKLSSLNNDIDCNKIQDLLQQINLKLKRISNYKLRLLVTNNIQNWCLEQYEDWNELLSNCKDNVINNFKYELNNGILQEQTLKDIVNIFYKITIQDSKLENYHRISELLCNISEKYIHKSDKNKNVIYIVC